MITVEKNKLIVDGKETIFDFDIETTKQLNNISIVLLHIPNGTDVFENVYGVDGNAQIIWRIPREFEEPMPYVGITLQDNGSLVCGDFWGRRVEINPQNGSIIRRLHEVRF